MARVKKHQKQLRNRLIMASLVVIVTIIVSGLILARTSVPVLQPAGPIAYGQRQLMFTAFLLMLIVVLPVFALLFTIAWRYRETNKKATYRPDWDRSRLAETIWWLVPSGLIMVLAIITWRGTHQYDPYKPLAVQADTITVQVVALDWRWLFIYPDQNVASLNEVRLPVKTAVRFDITADAPMNSFWIPQLGGQIYAMPGMSTRLNLMADKAGSYYGSSANISGRGFSDMNFQAKATSQADFDAWVLKARTQTPLTQAAYDKLVAPSTDKTVMYYGQPSADLYETIISKYMSHDHSHGSPTPGEGQQ